MVKVAFVVALAAIFVTIATAETQECGECDRSSCAELNVCLAGRNVDACGCCELCARSLGQRCHQNATSSDDRYGKCGENLQCRQRVDISGGEGMCECVEDGEVCGSDGVTHPSMCHLQEEAVTKLELHVKDRGPCLTAPVIKTPPKAVKRPLGAIMVMDCEVSGYPVPSITWELFRKEDGSVTKLPSDDPLIAVQVRGGPERHMVTGWVQIMRVTKENVGTYTCVATNSKGETRSSAEVKILMSGENQVNMNDL